MSDTLNPSGTAFAKGDAVMLKSVEECDAEFDVVWHEGAPYYRDKDNFLRVSRRRVCALQGITLNVTSVGEDVVVDFRNFDTLRRVKTITVRVAEDGCKRNNRWVFPACMLKLYSEIEDVREVDESEVRSVLHGFIQPCQ